MKHLIFIDNDDIERSKKVVALYVTPMLQAYGNLDEEYSTNIEIISDLYKKDKDELYNLFYSGKNVILSWSVYTPTSFHNSNQQLLHFLRVAGTSSVKKIIYLDMSGMVEDALSKLKYTDTKGLFQILQAIETNYIVSLVDAKFVRIRLDMSKKSGFKQEDIVLSELLECNAVA